MFSLRRLMVSALVVTATGLAAADAASAVTIGPPIPAPTGGFFTVDSSSGRFETLTPDPQGGLPWGMISYEAVSTIPGLPPSAVTCRTVGRLLLGKVGQLDENGEFRRYEPGAGPLSCGGNNPALDPAQRAGGSGLAQRNAVALSPDCGASCPPEIARKIHEGIIGRGVYAAWADVNGEWQPIPLSPYNRAFLVVRDAAWSGKLRFRATLCGPNARQDLTTRPGAVVDGCTVTFVWPPTFTPFPG